MGPHAGDLREYQRQHPEVIIKSPDETLSGKWEVSLPRSATMAFDDPEGMLHALSMTRVPADVDD